MKPITKAIERKLDRHPFGSQEARGMDAAVLVRFFGGGVCSWLVTEAERDESGGWRFFGLANLGYGWEWGSFDLAELESVEFPPFGLGVERDLYLPASATVRDFLKEA